MPAPNVGRALFALGSRRFRVRSGMGDYDPGGRWTETSDSDRMVRAVVRPISPSDRRLLPEGVQTEDSSIFLTRGSVVLKVERSVANGGAVADRVFVEGWWWRVVGEKPWVPNGFRRYLAIREDKGKTR